MPYYIVTTVLLFYERPLTLLEYHSSIAFIHMHEFQADDFSVLHTNDKDVTDMIYQLHEHAMPKFYTGVGDPFVEYCTFTHPSTMNRARAIGGFD